MTQSSATGTVLIYSIHRTEAWWRYVGENMGFDKSFVVSDLRNEGDYCVTDDFYHHQKKFYKQGATSSRLLSAENVTEIIARCRLLRFMPTRRAGAMALGMAEAFDHVLNETQPTVIVSFPIDRYVSDVLEYLAKARGIPFFELTVSAFAGMSMLMKKGVLCKHNEGPDEKLVKAKVDEMVTPLFTPTYVQGKTQFNAARFLKVFTYFRARAIAFKLISWWKRDRLSLHYLDAQSFLGHKPHLSDIRALSMTDPDWRSRLKGFDKEKRIFFGLQLFPEASIDYWIEDLELIEHEDLMVAVATAFSKAGYLILVKDHPLQFGFRQAGLIERLLQLENVVFVPYEVSGNEVLGECGVNFTCTGTLGLQAALLGLKSITTENYYTTPGDFILLKSFDQVRDLPAMVEETQETVDLTARQNRIIANLLKGSFESDFFSFQGFSPKYPAPGAKRLGELTGVEIRKLIEG